MSFPSLSLSQERLDNGLRVVLHRDSSLPLVAVNLWYHVGSKNERPGRTGLAHLFEHMLFQGSQNVAANDHFRLIQQVGGVVNGSTWYDRTNYYETVPSHHLELALWLESDRMGFLLPALSDDKLENQRSVVMNERRQRVDNQPYGRPTERVHELLYPSDHPYHWPVIGYMDDIAAATREDVAEFFRTYYSPSNAVLTLAGDFEPDDALKKVVRYFGSLPAGPEAPPHLHADLPVRVESSEMREVFSVPAPLPRVYLAFAVPPLGHPDWYAALVLSEVLTGGKSSTLYQDLVYRRQVATQVAAYLMPTEKCATLGFMLTGKPASQIEPLEADLLAQVERTQHDLVSEDQVEAAKSRILTGYFTALQSLDQRADLISQAATYFGDPHWILQEAARVQRVEPESLREAARRHLGRQASARVLVVPSHADSSEAVPS